MRRMIRSSLAAAAFATFGSAAAFAQEQPTAPPPGDSGLSRSEMQYRRTMQAREALTQRDHELNRERERKRSRKPKTADGRELKLSRPEREAVGTIQDALAARDYEEAAEAIAEALADAKTPDARYTFAALELQLGYDTGDATLQDKAVDAALGSGAAPDSLLPDLYRHQGVSALQAADYPKAEAAFAELVQLAPASAEAVMLLAETKNRARKPVDALLLFRRAVELKEAASQPVPPEWTRAIEALSAMVEKRTDG